MLRNSLKAVIGMAALALVIGLAPQISAKGGSVAVVDYSVNGNTVQVTLSNSDSVTHSGYLVVSAMVGDFQSRSVVYFSVQAHKSGTATVGFVGEVSNVLQVGISETGDPFD